MARYRNLGGGPTIQYDREKKTQVIEESPDPLVYEAAVHLLEHRQDGAPGLTNGTDGV